MAAEFGISIGAKISEYLVEPILIRPLRPIFCFQSIVDDFHDQKNRLSAVKEGVGNAVERDRRDSQVIFDHVKEWLQKVNTSMQEVQRLENELVQNKSCFRYSWCPNWTCHYCFSKQVSKMTATMKTLCDRGGFFISVSHPPALHQDIIGSSSSPSFIHSQSSRSALDQIMEALKKDDVNLINLYGRAGAGKTTMAQLVGEEAKKLLHGGAGVGNTTMAQLVGKEAKELFHHVIMVPVAQYPLVSSQQDFIAEFLGLRFDQLKSEQVRATKLQLRLRNGEKILIIFDDVQKEFNLGAVIGNPSSDSGCKCLLTTRHQKVAEIHVHTQKDIQLGSLSEDEAWTLLKSIAGVGDEVRTHDVAKDALEECNGLPKAIVAMGTILNGKDVHEWGETLQQHNVANFKFINILEEGVKNLSLRQDRVNTKIKTAKQNDEEIYTDVEKWLKDVERVMNDVEQFKKELNQNRWCLDKLGAATRVEALATGVNDLHEQGNFDQVSHPTPLAPHMRLLSSEDFLFSESAESAFNQILEALKTDGVNMIGLYGMGGIGKTTLARQVHNEVIRKNELAVMVTVSQKPDVGNMQDKIADFLDLELKKKTLEGRAIELKNRLKDKKILIMLDDVWKRFDLESIGITLDDCNDCKILMTTRRRDVCSSMNCQSEIQLNLFSEDESQKLFKKKAGLSNELELDNVGTQIVAECKCLPIALETVGAALKSKGKDEWVEALGKLRSARLVDIIGVPNDEKNAYRCLKLSYDYLNDQPQGSEAQFILLLCSLFPEDYEIKMEDLTRYAFGMNLFEEVESVEDARRKVRVAIRFLRGSCLLLDVGSEKYVKLHDVVRDVLLWIGATEPQQRSTLTVRDDVHLKDLIRKKSFQNCKALSFTSDVIPKFSEYSELEFPNLEIVLIFGEGFVKFGEGFFDHMKLLKVLDVRSALRGIGFKFAVPQSLQCLEHLCTLMLGNCKCSNSSILRDLGRLEILSLCCRLDCGVEVVSGLKKLRLLDLSRLEAKRRMCTVDDTLRRMCTLDVTIRRMFALDVTERLVKLEELYGYKWEKCNCEEGTSSKLYELKLPSKLVAVSLRVEDVRNLPRYFCFPKLEAYDIHIGKYINDPLSSTREVSRLVLSCVGNDVVMKTCEKLLPTVQVFHLYDCDGLYSLPSFNLQMLESLKVWYCQEMEWVLKVGNVSNLIDDLTCCCFTNLKELEVSYCDKVRAIFPLMKSTCRAHPQSHLHKLQNIVLKENRLLEHIWEGPIKLLSLCNLTQVEISRCPKLICIFSSSSLATSLQQLELILRKVGSDDNDDDDFTCCCFKNLRELKVSYCDRVKAIFPLMKSTSKAPPLDHQSHPCCLPMLQKIVMTHNSLLKHIWEGPTRLLSLCNLTQVHIFNCPELICIFPSPSLATSLQQLEILDIHGCDNLEEIFSRRGGSDDNDGDFICCCFRNLRELKVSKCHKVKAIFPLMKSTSKAPPLHPQSHPCRLPMLQKIVVTHNSLLKHIWEGPIRLLSLCNLTQVEIARCPGLICIFSSPSLATSLQQLEILDIHGCYNLEEVFSRRGGSDDNDDDFTCCCFKNLRELKVSRCHKVKAIFPFMKSTNRSPPFHPQSHPCRLPRLQEIILEDNSLLEHIFGHQTQAEVKECPSLQVLKVRRCPQISTTHLVEIQLQVRPPMSSYVQIVEAWLQRRHDDLSQSTIMCSSFLNRVELKDCNKLKQVFTTTIVNSLHLLEVLIVEGCNELEQVIGKVGDGKEEPSIGVSFENLKTLRVSHCGKLRTIFPISIALPQLEELELNSNAELEHVFGRSDSDCTWQCPFLKDLCLEDCPKLCSEFAACIQSLSTTKVVKNIQRDYDSEDDDNEDDDSEDDVKCTTQNIGFAYLDQIKVIGCHKLKHLFTTNFATNFPTLRRLIVRRCNELEVIMVEDGKKEREHDAATEMIAKVGFENLEALHVSDCKKLKTVFSTFTPLPKLDTLLLQSNAVLESLFGQSGGDDCTSHWTRIIVLSVTGCPKLCTETIAIIKSQLRVQSTTKAPWIINLSNIEGVEELIQIPRQDGDDDDDTIELQNEFLKVEELGDLKRIWSGPTQDISFSLLFALRVIGCRRLKQLFTTAMVTSLHSLELLWVERCDDLQQIIEEEENNTQSVQQLKFSKLDTLRLIDLPKLISFCPTSCSLVFPYLTEKRVKVKGCPEPITDFFSKQNYQGKEYEYDSVDEDEDDGKFEDEINLQYCTYKFGWVAEARKSRPDPPSEIIEVLDGDERVTDEG